MALRLRGWKLWYEPRLQLKHYIPVERLNWEYFRRLLRGVGMSSLGLDPYYFALQNKKMKKLKQRFFIRTWQIQVLISLIEDLVNYAINENYNLIIKLHPQRNFRERYLPKQI